MLPYLSFDSFRFYLRDTELLIDNIGRYVIKSYRVSFIELAQIKQTLFLLNSYIIIKVVTD